jgi:polysaccharide biosynthesis/export protein
MEGFMFAVRALRLAGCLVAIAPAAYAQEPAAQSQPEAAAAQSPGPEYRIAPGDELQIFVWKNPELSTQAPVRPDGRITTPLVQDIQAQGKTTTELAASLRDALSAYIQQPVVNVVVRTVAAPNNAAAIRVVGAAATPKTVPYRKGMTVLDVMIDVGGLNPFAAGNRARLIRQSNGQYATYPLRLADLVKNGNMKANMELMPGDVIQIPQRGF